MTETNTVRILDPATLDTKPEMVSNFILNILMCYLTIYMTMKIPQGAGLSKNSGLAYLNQI